MRLLAIVGLLVLSLVGLGLIRGVVSILACLSWHNIVNAASLHQVLHFLLLLLNLGYYYFRSIFN